LKTYLRTFKLTNTNQRVIKLIVYFYFLCSLKVHIFATIIGSGANFPHPFLKEAFDQYSTSMNVSINYTPHGSKNGYIDLKNQEVDFAAVDLFLSDKLINQLPEPRDILHIPITLSGIGIAYSLPNIQDLNLTPTVLAELLIGKITHWNDPKIQALNPNSSLPNLKVIRITREAGSGSTYILTQYLSFLNSAWKQSFGVSSTLEIPGTLRAKNSQEMGELIAQIPGSIGYIGIAYQKLFGLSFAAMQNSAGLFIKPTLNFILRTSLRK